MSVDRWLGRSGGPFQWNTSKLGATLHCCPVHTHILFFQWQPLTAPLYSHHGEFCCDIVAADLVVLDAGAGTAGAKETSISSATAAATTASCADKLLPLCLFITPQLTVCTKYGSGF